MKEKIIILFLLFGAGLRAQTALQNTGNLRIHENGQMGFHTDLVNDGLFDENMGLVGFYGNSEITVSGALNPSFFDAEFVTQKGVTLNNTVNILNNANFVTGDVSSPKSNPNISLNFPKNGFHSGASDISKVNGYASVSDKQSFTFPVGDDTYFRPLILKSQNVNPVARCAYFFENPNTPSTFDTSFSTSARPVDVSSVSTLEFWVLEGSEPSTVELSWNERSAIGSLTEDISEVVLVGWSKASNTWEHLGGPASVGDLFQGVAVSDSFVPNDYAAITFAASAEPRDYLELDDYLVTPNGDNVNDFLEIPQLDQSPNNHMKIYDRNGSKVFDQVNYTNEFNGFSNVDNFVIARDEGLPSGVYFYIVSMEDVGLTFQGFLYLAND
ncbi:gliding motility-associated C-terminal domain-containing protein [Pricia sp. S334]|uniref:Gliding motility-associated C-terminal domain-containing protein n=1 Tax=Pricia mediterranea TaxID=3076079 RepID=A0ABU3L7Q6_9FLAO|nr:gliding motility-associated C-terminal domain-containing protein [Pricia sp. S334]MDT7829710.1 gliding motility-associated C-terminal domain-containing protein [Pricia sp. S334]